MPTFDWALDHEYALPNGVALRVLQRLVDNPHMVSEDLTPFVAAPGYWDFTSPGDRIAGEGVLLQYDGSEGADRFSIHWAEHAWPSDVSVDHVTIRQLTVWRFMEQLDLLQIRFVGMTTTLYGHIGGEHTLRMFAKLGPTAGAKSSLASAMKLFETGRLPTAET
jgi:hypothetical protein